MMEHRAAVNQKLVDQETARLRKLNLGRDQILTRLWELATLSHEATRGTIAGQIKALSMIVAIEGLIPSGKMNDRRLSSATQPVAPAVKGTAEPGLRGDRLHLRRGSPPCRLSRLVRLPARNCSCTPPQMAIKDRSLSNFMKY